MTYSSCTRFEPVATGAADSTPLVATVAAAGLADPSPVFGAADVPLPVSGDAAVSDVAVSAVGEILWSSLTASGGNSGSGTNITCPTLAVGGTVTVIVAVLLCG